MQSFSILSLVLAAAGLASAVPAASSRQFAAQVTFIGAASSYTESIPADSTPVYFGTCRPDFTLPPRFSPSFFLFLFQLSTLAARPDAMTR